MNEYYQKLYGERWPQLLKAMESDEFKVCRPCGQSGEDPFSYPHFESGQDINSSFYVMDPASILAAELLGVSANDVVLDMCAAPGGKSLILAESLGPSGKLFSNEVSQNRRLRLLNVLREYLSEEKMTQVQVVGKDGLRFGMEYPEFFDRILVDAPCSGERHILKDPKELKKWTPKRTKKLASTQYGLLCSALLALKPGGTLVYSTCSISPLENTDVLAKLSKKKGDQFTFDLPKAVHPLAHKDEHGFGLWMMPDKCMGAGPIFMTRIKKVSP